jgi:hypothetical protein
MVVDESVAVVVFAVADLDAAVAWRAGILTPVVRIAIDIVVARQAVDPTLSLLAASAGVGGTAHVAALSTVVWVGLQVEAFVNGAIAVVVRAIADLDATVALHALAAVSCLAIKIDVTGIAAAHPALACQAGRLAVGNLANLPAHAAVLWVSLKVGPTAAPIRRGSGLRIGRLPAIGGVPCISRVVQE